MIISEKLQKQVEELCEIQSGLIKELKEDNLSQAGKEKLKMLNELIGEKVEQIKKSKHQF